MRVWYIMKTNTIVVALLGIFFIVLIVISQLEHLQEGVTSKKSKKKTTSENTRTYKKGDLVMEDVNQTGDYYRLLIVGDKTKNEMVKTTFAFPKEDDDNTPIDDDPDLFIDISNKEEYAKLDPWDKKKHKEQKDKEQAEYFMKKADDFNARYAEQQKTISNPFKPGNQTQSGNQRFDVQEAQVSKLIETKPTAAPP